MEKERLTENEARVLFQFLQTSIGSECESLQEVEEKLSDLSRDELNDATNVLLELEVLIVIISSGLFSKNPEYRLLIRDEQAAYLLEQHKKLRICK
ncbi:hypothetical protein VCHA38O209_140029 [Vibrio chagasii]|nr:hypothetical protein VCHA38O209_140029 [Vibrio chagasii]